MPNNPSSLSMPDEILDAALAKEHQARDFYTGLAARCRIEMVRDLLERLADEEYKHIRLIEDMQTRLRLGQDAV